MDITDEFIVDSCCQFFKATYYPNYNIVNIKAFSNGISIANGYKIATASSVHTAKDNVYHAVGFRTTDTVQSVKELCALNPTHFNLYGDTNNNATSFQIDFNYFVNK